MPEIEIRVMTTGEEIIGLEYLFDTMVDEVIIGIQMLLHQPSHLQARPIHCKN